MQEMSKEELEKALDFFIKRADEGGWIGDGVCGASSNAMCRFMVGYDNEPTSYPHDEDDWGRCKRTIQQIPNPDWCIKLLNLPKYKGWQKWKGKLIYEVTERLRDIYGSNSND